jgi:signal transduction histidine kinase
MARTGEPSGRIPGYRHGVTAVIAPWRRHYRQAADTLLALALLAAAEAFLFTSSGSAAARPAAAALVATAVIPLAWRHQAPVAVLAISGIAVVTSIAMHAPPGAAVLAPLIALYTVAATRERQVSVAAGVIALAALTIGVAAGTAVPATVDRVNVHALGFLLAAVVVAACWLAGKNVRTRRAYVAELTAKAARTEADRQAELARAAAEERARIARELHDAVVHHVSVIAVQAGAARMLSGNGTGPADASQMWSAVEDTARQALTELRQLLGLLRHGGETPGLAPQPRLDQLGRLLDETRGAGLPAELRVDGEQVPLTSAAEHSAYRIVQEALTNVMKHQGQVPTVVSLRYRPRELEITVVSDPVSAPPPVSSASRLPGTPPAARGHGLIGMRERVAMFGGDLDAGPTPDGGFTVHARIPIGDL